MDCVEGVMAVRIGHASISENNNNGRDGKAKAGDQTGKEVCIRTFYKKPWAYLLRCKDANKAEIMAKACESICNNPYVGYNQLKRMTLLTALKLLNYDYSKLNFLVECDCSSLMTGCAECAGIFPKYSNNAPVTANMVRLFEETKQFDVLTEGINKEENLRRGDILVGAPNTHTVMVLDDGKAQKKSRPVLKRGSRGEDVIVLQKVLRESGFYQGAIDGIFGQQTDVALRRYQSSKQLEIDGICGRMTWAKIEEGLNGQALTVR